MSKIHFDITADNSNVVSTINDTTNRFQKFAKIINDYGRNMKWFDASNAKASLKSLEKAITENETIIREYKKNISELTLKLREASAAGDIRGVEQYTLQLKEQASYCQNLVNDTNMLKEAYGNFSGKVKDAGGVMEKLLGGQKNYNAIIAQLPGPLRAATQGLNGMVGAAKAFIATPLGVVLAGLILAYKALTTWLTKSAEGQMALAKISGYYKGIVMALEGIVKNLGKALYDAFTNPKQAAQDFLDFLRSQVANRVKAIAEMFTALGSIIKNVFSGDFDAAKESLIDLGKAQFKFTTGFDADDVKDKVTGVVNDIKNVAEAESALNIRREKLARERSEWLVKEAELQRQIAEEQNKMYTGSAEEKTKAAARAQELINQKYAQQLKFAKEEYAIKKESNSLRPNNSQQDIDEEYRLKAAIIDVMRAKEAESRMFVRRGHTADEAGIRAEQKAENELMSLILKNEEKRISMIKDQTDREVQAIELKYRKAIEEIKKKRKEWEEANRLATGSSTLSNEQEKALIEAEKLATEERNRELEKAKRAEDDAQNEYLRSYGTYWEKRYAITKEYQDKIADTTDSSQRAMYYKQMQKELHELEKSYGSLYSLIFADAASLPNNLLKDAIQATQEEIEKATKSGDIEQLTELYKRLNEQMAVQTDRNRGWGFFGLSTGFGLLKSAQNKRDLAALYNSMEDDGSGIDWKKESKDLFDQSLTEEQQAMKAIEQSVSEIGSAFSQLGRELQQFDGVLGDIGKTFSAIGDNADVFAKAFSGTMEPTEAISVAIQSTIQLLGMVISSIKANEEAQKKWNLTIEAAEQKYRLLQIEALDYYQRNIFGVENPYQRAIDGAKQYTEALTALNEQVVALSEGKVQTGVKKVVDWGNVGKGAGIGAAAGAAVGSIIPGIGNIIGAAVGAAIGLLTGAVVGLLSTKTEPIFESLAEHYGQIFDPETYKLNEKIIADYEKLDDATKQIVDNWDKIVAKAKEAEEQMRQNFSDLAGDIGTKLSDALVNAFRNGNLYDAIDDFHETMTETIEDILSQLVFSAAFGAMFDELEQRMMDSFGIGGDQNIVDDLMWMEGEYQKKLGEYEEAMVAVRESLQGMGYNAYSSEFKNAQASKGGFQTMSESTGSELNGRFASLQISNETISQTARDGLAYIITISNMVSVGNSTLDDIRNLHVREVFFLEDIAKQTKPLLTFGEKLDSIAAKL